MLDGSASSSSSSNSWSESSKYSEISWSFKSISVNRNTQCSNTEKTVITKVREKKEKQPFGNENGKMQRVLYQTKQIDRMLTNVMLNLVLKFTAIIMNITRTILLEIA